ncbi:MAG: cell division protein FtsZ [Bacteroidales bacterium]|nr:cell division protein FtsZ [Bacteroidales bacterium]
MITFQPKQHPSIIKVLGVGGGGSNAVNHMFKQGITGVEFAICNTDLQALESSPVPIKIEIGNKNGLGAGANPEVGKLAAEGSLDKIKELLSDESTQMLFITAGMGGGTGTGAAPVIAKLAREMGILTVGIVTLPFNFEGRKRRKQAELGIAEIKKYVDSLLVISNDKLRQQFGDLILSDAFAKADNVLTTAAKGIAELITVTGYVNVDFEDVKTVIKDSGKAIMGSARAEGDDRAIRAIEQAMNSPLLNDNDVKGATDILLYIMTGTKDIRMDEITEITEYVQKESGEDADIIWGTGTDETLGDAIGITIIATGFETVKPQPESEHTVIGVIGQNHIATPVKPNQPVVENIFNTDDLTHAESEIKLVKTSSVKETVDETTIEPPTAKIVRTLDLSSPGEKSPETTTATTTKNPISLIRQTPPNPYLSVGHTVSSVSDKEAEKIIERKPNENDEEDGISKNAIERINKLRNLSINLRSPEKMIELENQPAYIRKKIELEDTNYSSGSTVSRYTLGEDTKNQPVIKSDNSFLHDNVD